MGVFKVFCTEIKSRIVLFINPRIGNFLYLIGMWKLVFKTFHLFLDVLHHSFPSVTNLQEEQSLAGRCIHFCPAIHMNALLTDCLSLNHHTLNISQALRCPDLLASFDSSTQSILWVCTVSVAVKAESESVNSTRWRHTMLVGELLSSFAVTRVWGPLG